MNKYIICEIGKYVKKSILNSILFFSQTTFYHFIFCFRLMETLSLKKLGFCFSLDYCEFLYRYKMLSVHTWPYWGGNYVDGVTYLLRELPISANEYSFGRTKIFIRSLNTVSLYLIL